MFKCCKIRKQPSDRKIWLDFYSFVMVTHFKQDYSCYISKFSERTLAGRPKPGQHLMKQF